MKKRENIEEKYKWDFSDYFKDDEAWEKEYADYSNEIKGITYFDGKLDNKKNILEMFKMLENLSIKLEALYIYANCVRDTDVTNTKSMARLNKVTAKLTEQSVLTSFIEPQLSLLDNEFLNGLIKDPDFQDYSKMLKDVVREKEHILSRECEEILSQSSSYQDTFKENHTNFEGGDLKFNKVKNAKGKLLPMGQSLASLYLRDKDEVLRENAYKELQGAYGRYNNFLSTNYLGSVKKDVFYARARKFDSVLDSALFYEEVDKVVYEMLLENTLKNLGLNQKFFEVKRKLLGLKKFKLSDIYYNPFVSNKKYTFESAINVVCDALSVLGKDYTDYIRYMAEKRMIDVYPNEGKVSGAYETMATKKTPRVFTNFMGTSNDVSTLAHELGHAMHSVLSDKSQSSFNAGYTIFLAEIASTVNETILNDHMLNCTDDKKEKIFYLNEFLSNFYATVFRQTMFADFEDKIHKKVEKNEEVSAKVLNDTYFELVKKFFGKKVKIFDEVKFEWSRIPHFYRAYYVYKYATGLISAINIVENLRTGKIKVDNYKKFLSSGCSDTPLNLLKIVKVDLTTEEPFNVAFKYFSERLSLLEKLSKQ